MGGDFDNRRMFCRIDVLLCYVLQNISHHLNMGIKGRRSRCGGGRGNFQRRHLGKKEDAMSKAVIQLVLSVTFLAITFQPLIEVWAGSPEEGRKLFLAFCSACHGAVGKGDGEASKYLDIKPQDFTDQSVMVKLSDQDIFNFIHGENNRFHGARFLPGFQLQLTEIQIWDLVSFIRTLHTKPKGDPVNGRKLYLLY